MDDVRAKSESLKEKVALLVRTRRLDLGLSQEDVGHLADLSVQSVSSIERGRTLPALDTLLALGKALGFDPADLFATVNLPEFRLVQEIKARSFLRRLDDAALAVAVTQLEALTQYAEQVSRPRKRAIPTKDR